jgi:hypothetical protein
LLAPPGGELQTTYVSLCNSLPVSETVHPLTFCL